MSSGSAALRYAVVAALMLIGFLGVAPAVAGAYPMPPAVPNSLTCTITGSTISCDSQVWAVGTSVSYSIASTPTALGTVTTLGDGTAPLTNAALPVGIEQGTHTVSAAGTSTAGTPQTLQTTVLLTPASTVVDAASGSRSGIAAAGGPAATLPKTGASHIDPFLWVAGISLASGAALLALSRRRARSTS